MLERFAQISVSKKRTQLRLAWPGVVTVQWSSDITLTHNDPIVHIKQNDDSGFSAITYDLGVNYVDNFPRSEPSDKILFSGKSTARDLVSVETLATYFSIWTL